MKLFNNDELVNGQMLPDCWIFFGVINHKPAWIVRLPFPWFGEKEAWAFLGSIVGWMVPSFRLYYTGKKWNFYFINIMIDVRQEIPWRY
jgi:hypothetical protein